jgi:hypothetical protein
MKSRGLMEGDGSEEWPKKMEVRRFANNTNSRYEYILNSKMHCSVSKKECRYGIEMNCTVGM